MKLTAAQKRKRFDRRLNKLLLRVDYTRRPGLGFSYRMEGTGAVLWVRDWVVNVDTGKSGLLEGPFWFVDDRYSDEGIIRQVFRALLAFEEHELREFFTYKGEKVFNPHSRSIV